MPDKETQDYYRQRAETYEEIYYRDQPDRRKEIDDEVVRLRELVTGKSVLELACGTGYWTKIMSETANAITASDLSDEMLAIARHKPLVAPVTFQQADMFGHSWPQGAFDMVAVGFWFSHQPRQEYERFFDLIATPLAKGGAIWLIDNNPPAEGPEHEHIRIDEFGNNFKRRHLKDGRTFTILKNYFSEQELRDLFSPRFTIRRLTYGVYYWSVELGVGS
ncbi:MAG: class I SAM-dependent methyltransferase [candidate division Zixibacteria bacterium]|nr:class I SAM-dependent methyltransferase [candidate division Zixibacteria bacterium]